MTKRRNKPRIFAGDIPSLFSTVLRTGLEVKTLFNISKPNPNKGPEPRKKWRKE
jgi:hypothetical protein